VSITGCTWIRTDDDVQQLLATAGSLPGALEQTDRLGAAVHRQLERNGEGHKSFWLQLVVTDPAGQDVAWSATNGDPGHPIDFFPTEDPYAGGSGGVP
jgi:hypothetical protein